jgi:DNA repair protein RadA/Sms
VVRPDAPRAPSIAAGDRSGVPPRPIAEIDGQGARPRPTGIAELDRVLGGGIVAGSVTLAGGEPGMGKSTLVLQALGALAERGARCVLVAAEESPEQVRSRADRLGVSHAELFVAAQSSLPELLAHVDDVAPDVLVIDSIQTVFDPGVPGGPGSVTQVRECAHALVRLAKERALATILVGHVTKDGQLAGPRALEHIVDTVLHFEGDRHHALRLLRALKHRFGPTDELGLFEMTASGLVGVSDASALLLTDRCLGQSGSVVAPVLDGARPLLVEVQALVGEQTQTMTPRRTAQAFDNGRLAMLVAVLQRRLGVSFLGRDVFASIAGGVRVDETGADLALALAIVSATIGAPVPPLVVALGEVGLGGEIRSVPQAPRRLAEAARLGFDVAIVPRSTVDVAGIEVVRVATVADAACHLFGRVVPNGSQVRELPDDKVRDDR